MERQLRIIIDIKIKGSASNANLNKLKSESAYSKMFVFEVTRSSYSGLHPGPFKLNLK